MVFAIHWHESAMGVPYMCPPPWTPLPPLSLSPPSGLSQSTGFECPVSCIQLGLVIYVTYGHIRISLLFSQIIPPGEEILTESLVLIRNQRVPLSPNGRYRRCQRSLESMLLNPGSPSAPLISGVPPPALCTSPVHSLDEILLWAAGLKRK